MPTRLAIRVPRTYTDADGREQRRYTDAGAAFVADDADRVDLNFHPGIAVSNAIVMMPRREPTDAGLPLPLPLPSHLAVSRYHVTTSWRFVGEDGATVTRYATVGVLFRNRAGTGFNLRANDGLGLLDRVVAFPAEPRAQGAGAVAPPDPPFDDDLGPARDGLREAGAAAG